MGPDPNVLSIVEQMSGAVNEGLLGEHGHLELGGDSIFT